MLRFLLAGLLVSGAVLGSVGPAWALDYEEPVVPPQFLLGSPAVEAPVSLASLRLLVLRSETPELIQEVPGGVAEAGAVVRYPTDSCRGSSGDGIGGRALWNWN